ncbi:hypothetical protein JCM10207_004717 [Rhodosporidiobolus poonsookiae]
MEDLIPELQGFTPRSSASQFAIDPALAGPGPSSSASRARRSGGASQYWDENEEDDYSDEEEEDEEDEDETDAEDEFAAVESAGFGAKRGRKSAGGIMGDDGTVTPGGSLKGKGRAIDQDADEDDENPEELSRLISAIRDSNATTVGGGTALAREFDRSIADELDGFDPDLIEDLSVGIKGRKRKRGKRNGGRRRAGDVEPSPEVKRLLGQANEAYANGELLQAIELLSEVVRIDPIIRASWYTLATIYEELQEKEKAVQCKIVATHLMGARQAAADWAELGRESRDIGLLHQAIYCFTQAVKANKDDVDAMWDRAILLKLSGASIMAIRAFLALLSLLPHDPGVLRELAPLLASTQQYQLATTLLLSAFAYYRQLVPDVTAETVDLLNTYGYSDLETLADFLLLQRNWPEAVRVIRQGVRWLQGRERENGWDAMADDREYDEERKVREGWEKGNTWFELEPTYELDVRLRSRLGLARLGMGWKTEAQHHFDIVTSEDVSQFPELFGAIGEAFYDRGMYEQALDVYQLIAENEETNGPTVWTKIAQCHEATGGWDDARECYENVIDEEPGNVEAKLALAKILEQLNEPARALQLIKEVITARENQDETDSQQGGRRRPWISKEQRAAMRVNRENDERARHAEFASAFERLKELDAAVDAGDEEASNQWLEIATTLVDSFRSTKALYPADFKKKFTGVFRSHRGRRAKKRDLDADVDQMANRLEATLVPEEENAVEETQFRSLGFDGWVDLVLKYSFLLTKAGDVDLAAQVLKHVREASVMRQVRSREEALRFGLVACYVHAGMHNQILDECRWFQNAYALQTEPLRLLLALLASSQSATAAYNEARFQKFFTRQLRMIYNSAVGGGDGKAAGTGEAPSSPAEARKSSAVQGKGKAVEPDDEVGDGDGDFDPDASTWRPTQLSPLYLTVYGCLLNVSQSHQGAIIYLLRAYELDKKQPLINLVLATAYIQRSLSRKTDNRQHQIAQGFAFLEQYRKLRGPCQETEYNLARAFHHLGIQSHAVKHYESVLRTPPIASPDSMALDGDAALDRYASTDYRKTAAYNLATLYTMTGSPELARGVAEKWLAA